MSQIKHSDEQEPNTPNLHAVSKQDPFQVPSGYFESLPDAILQRIAKEEQQSPRVVAMPSRRQYWAAASVAACLLIAIGLYFMNQRVVHQVAETASNKADTATAIVAAEQPAATDKKEIVNYLMDHDVELSNITEAL